MGESGSTPLRIATIGSLLPMPIRVVCECGSRLDAPDELAGRQAKCGNCGCILTIRESSPAEVKEPASLEGEDAPRLPPRVIRKRKKVYRDASAVIEEGATTKKKRKRPSPTSQAPSRPSSIQPLLIVWKRGLLFPLQRESLITLLVMAALYGTVSKGLLLGPAVFAAGIIGIKSIVGYLVIGGIIVGYLFYFLFQTLRSTAQDDQDLPVAAAFEFDEIFIDLWLMLGGTIVVFLPLIALEITAWWSGWELWPRAMRLLSLALMFLWPMGVTAAALHTSVLAANHWTTAVAILKMPFQYAATLLVATGLISVTLLIDHFLPRIFFISGFISSFLFFYTTVACIALMGYLYYRNRANIGWFGELQSRY